MILVVILGAAIWGLGAWMKVPAQARLLMLALLYVAILFIQFALPEGHPLREELGGGPGQWLVLGGLVLAFLVYRAGLGRVRDRAREVEAARDETELAQAPARQGAFSDVELERYARHIVLREVGGPGQRRLKEACILVVGAGGLGSPVLLYLGAAGLGTIGIIDDDIVSLSNLQRQVIHTDARSGQPKVFSAEAGLRAINPHVTVRPYNRRLTADIAPDLFADYDLILDGSDSFATRQIVNEAAVAAGKPVVAGAITQWEGQVTIYDPAGGAPCLACLFPEAPAPGLAPSCAEAGVMGALPGVIGSIMAMETIKEVTGAGTTLRGAMLLWDGLDAEARRVTVRRRADCSVCGDI
ncbi:putative adenylyltransferase/sulfurtransferase MoeZ [Jannaschia seosinensis]|uniref:Molybdopterin-synthase adenylyltransferase n=1 Tax=Jannaschia seosinensis TaxID=313367 RepID=A0A0M7B8E1_9RHOB|nr:HesA/MoeB/ThiF family protein [Jannaschia seosinensis]CUH27575.1 putative adenylyltransferase/sulfurtransferase MoeZ [Jannaschia seosinensis]